MTPPRPRPAAAAGPDLVSATLLLWALTWLVVSFSHVAGAWGLDTLRHAPGSLGLFVLALLVLACVPATAVGMRAACDGLGRALASRGPAAGVLVALVIFVALLALRDPLHFVGDSGLRLAAITVRGDTGTVFPQAAPLDRLINLHFARALRDTLPISDADALQWAGALVGACWAATGLAFLRALDLRGAALGAAAMVLWSSGVMVHFAGYDKFGPLTLGLALAATGAVRALAGARPWLLVLGVTLALLSHRTGLLTLPAAVFVLATTLRRGGDARRDGLIALAALAAVAIVAIPQALASLQSIDRARHLSSWAPRQLWDALQLLWLLCPLWVAAVVAMLPIGARPARAEAGPGAGAHGWLIALGLGPWLALLLLVRGSQGAARDWDMHVPAASLVALATVAALGLAWQRAGAGPRPPARSLALAVALALGTGFASWNLHVSLPAQLARIDDQLQSRAAWSNEAWARAQDFMGIHALRTGRAEQAIAHWEAAIEGAPNPRFFYQVALAEMRLGRLDAARAGFTRTQSRDPANADAWVGRAMVASGLDSMAAAMAYVDTALSRQPRKWDALELRRKLLQYQGQ